MEGYFDKIDKEYSLYHKSRVDSKEGGLCIFVNDKSLKSYEIIDEKFLPILSEVFHF